MHAYSATQQCSSASRAGASTAVREQLHGREPISVAGQQAGRALDRQLPRPHHYHEAQGTLRLESQRCSGAVAPRPSYCLAKLSFQGQSAQEVELDPKSLRPPDLHIVERNNNNLYREVTGRFRHGRLRKHARSLGQSLHPRLPPEGVLKTREAADAPSSKVTDGSGRTVSRQLHGTDYGVSLVPDSSSCLLLSCLRGTPG